MRMCQTGGGSLTIVQQLLKFIYALIEIIKMGGRVTS
jgi:hypothetical protein